MLPPLITAFYTAIMALFFLGLTYYVIAGRWKHKVAIADGGNKDMVQRIRMHGNFAEFVPLLLIIMLLLELCGLANLYLHIYGISLCLARVSLAYGLYKTTGFSIWRFMGNLLTHILILVGVAGCFCFYFFFCN